MPEHSTRRFYTYDCIRLFSTPKSTVSNSLFLCVVSAGRRIADQMRERRFSDFAASAHSLRRPPSPLEQIRPDCLPASYTEDLINLLHVLAHLTALEADQADPLERICSGSLIGAELLRAGVVFDDDSAATTRVGDDLSEQIGFLSFGVLRN